MQGADASVEQKVKKRVENVASKLATWGVSPTAITVFTKNKGDVSRFHALFCGKNPLVIVDEHERNVSVVTVDTSRALQRAKPITSATVLAMRARLEEACAGAVLGSDCEEILKQTRRMMRGKSPQSAQLPEVDDQGPERKDPPASEKQAKLRARKQKMVSGLPSPRSGGDVVSLQPPIAIQRIHLAIHPNAIEIFSASKEEMLDRHGNALDTMQAKIQMRATNRSPDERPFVTNQSKGNRAKLIGHSKAALEARIKSDKAYATSKTTIVQYGGTNPLTNKIYVADNYPQPKWSAEFIDYSQLEEGDQFLAASDMSLGGGVLEDVGPNFAQEEQAFFQCTDLLLFVASDSRDTSGRTQARPSQYATATSHENSWPVLIKGTTPILTMPESVARITSRSTAATPDNVFLSPTEEFRPQDVLKPAKGAAVSMLCVAAPKTDRNTEYDEIMVRDMIANFAKGVKMLDPNKPFKSVAWGAGIFGHSPEMSAAIQILICMFYGIDLTIHGMDRAAFEKGRAAANEILRTFDSALDIRLDQLIPLLVDMAKAQGWTLGKK